MLSLQALYIHPKMKIYYRIQVYVVENKLFEAIRMAANNFFSLAFATVWSVRWSNSICKATIVDSNKQKKLLIFAYKNVHLLSVLGTNLVVSKD